MVAGRRRLKPKVMRIYRPKLKPIFSRHLLKTLLFSQVAKIVRRQQRLVA
jgi:hypothetical protein